MGLINSSLARDLKIKILLASSAYSRRLSTINKIKKLKLVDFASINIEKTIKEADIIVGIPHGASRRYLKKYVIILNRSYYYRCRICKKWKLIQ